jgi:hypothetical protein
MHVHSFLGGHSTGTFDAIIAGARANRLDFVVMTEHTSKDFDTSAMTLKGSHDGVLFINGNEVRSSSGDRFLLLPSDATASHASESTIDDYLAQQKTNKSLAFIAYPTEFKGGWSSCDGVEVYNVFTNARRINPLLMFFDGLWSYRAYPDLLFSRFYQRPNDSLELWDQQTVQSGRRYVATAGNDAHANIGFSLNDSSGKKLLGMQLDPYERSFHLVRMHVLLPAGQTLTSESLLAALQQGHCFIAYDLFADATGFRFTLSTGNEIQQQGDEVVLTGQMKLAVTAPLPSRILLFRDGAVQQEMTGSNVEFEVNQKGVYRVEVYLSQLPKPVSEQPWIISNPIYVR